MRRFLICLLTLLAPISVNAAGYDTPMTHSAKYIGMGGTAIGYVNDASALYHNPAALSKVSGFGLAVSVSPLFGQLQASPHPQATNIDSNPSFSPFFMAAASYQISDLITVAAGFYPLGGGGGGYSYEYDSSSGALRSVEDTTQLTFLEASVGVSVKLMKYLSLGLAWRGTLTTFKREVVNTEAGSSSAYIDMDMSGQNWAGFRAGLSFQMSDNWGIGLTYRHRVDTQVSADKATVTGIPAEDGTYDFTIPSKLGLGTFVNFDQWRLAMDIEYAFNSQNGVAEVKGTAFGTPVAVKNIANWSDSVTVRLGAAYKITKMVEGRIGYAHDTQAAANEYPTAFGTPPGATNVFTLGAGLQLTDTIQLSVALAHRRGSGETKADDIPKTASGAPECAFCGHPGVYSLSMWGAYIDASFQFGG